MALSPKEEQQISNLAVGVGLSVLRKAFSKGAMPASIPDPQVNVFKINGVQLAKDNRVRIQVPPQYHNSSLMNGPKDYESGVGAGLSTFKGIIFPYTPSISYETKATYSSKNPVHSNYTQNFYQNSSVSPITITGKFTVENDQDAAYLLMTLHLLRTLTKMKTGGDANPGVPPPVCKLSAYGNYMLDNVPVVISSFTHDLPDNVDYFTTSKQAIDIDKNFENNFVPVISSIKIICTPVYSRRQMTDFSVDKMIAGDYNQSGSGKGYL